MSGAIDCDVWVVAEGGTAMVYVTRESRRAELVPMLRQELAKLPGVSHVILPAEYEQFGYPKHPEVPSCSHTPMSVHRRLCVSTTCYGRSQGFRSSGDPIAARLMPQTRESLCADSVEPPPAEP